MNKWIKKELQKCKVQLPEWDDNTTLMVITPKIHYISKLNVNDELTIEIKDYIINEPSNFTLSSNWNNNTYPPEHYMRVKVLKIIGKMICVDGFGINTNTYWQGYLPRKSFSILERC